MLFLRRYGEGREAHVCLSAYTKSSTFVPTDDLKVPTDFAAFCSLLFDGINIVLNIRLQEPSTESWNWKLLGYTTENPARGLWQRKLHDRRAGDKQNELEDNKVLEQSFSLWLFLLLNEYFLRTREWVGRERKSLTKRSFPIAINNSNKFHIPQSDAAAKVKSENYERGTLPKLVQQSSLDSMGFLIDLIVSSCTINLVASLFMRTIAVLFHQFSKCTRHMALGNVGKQASQAHHLTTLESLPTSKVLSRAWGEMEGSLWE